MNFDHFSTFLKRVPKFITGATLLAFLVLVFMGIFDCANPIMQSRMTMDGAHGSMADCVPGENCGMDIGEHIAIWQGMITTNLTANFFSLLAMLLLVVFIFKIYKLLPTKQIVPLISRYLHYDRDHRESRLYNYFIQIFSNGILQPKLFA